MIKCGLYPLAPNRRGGVSVGQASLPALVAGTEAHPTYQPGERVRARGNLIVFSCQMGRSKKFRSSVMLHNCYDISNYGFLTPL